MPSSTTSCGSLQAFMLAHVGHAGSWLCRPCMVRYRSSGHASTRSMCQMGRLPPPRAPLPPRPPHPAPPVCHFHAQAVNGNSNMHIPMRVACLVAYLLCATDINTRTTVYVPYPDGASSTARRACFSNGTARRTRLVRTARCIRMRSCSSCASLRVHWNPLHTW